MGVRHDPDSIRTMIAELERVLGRPLPAGGTVVDVGAGTGNVAVKLAIDGRFDRVVAIDISDEMLKQATAAAQLAGVTIETIVDPMVRLPMPDRSVDLLVGCAVLHHLPHPRAFLTEVERVLKPGATFIFIGEPSTVGGRITNLVKSPAVLLARSLAVLRRKDVVSWDHDGIDVHTFTPEDVESMVGTGFEQFRFVPEGFAAPVIDQAVLVLVQALFGHVPGVQTACGATVRGLRWLDGALLEHVVPRTALASVKFSAVRSSTA